MKPIIYLTSFLIITAFASCSGDEQIAAIKRTDKPVAVTVATPSSNNENKITASGVIEAVKTAAISTRVMGRITSVKVKLGDKVRKGQLLVTISDEDIRAKRAQTQAMIAEAEAALIAAQKDYDRFAALYKQQSATAKELENVTLQLSAVQSKAEAARQMKNEVNAMLNYTALTAPFDGVITQKNAEEGAIANPGMPLLVVENSGEMQVSVSISEADINALKLNQTANVEVKSNRQTFTGTVTQINPSSQFSGSQYVAKISIPATERKNLYAGMYVNVALAADRKENKSIGTVLVPVSSIVYKDELTGIYTISSENTAMLRWVRLGKTYGDKVEVLSGLAANETYIISSDAKLSNGAPVVKK